MSDCEDNAAVSLLEQGYWITSYSVDGDTKWEIDGVVIQPDEPIYRHLLRLPLCAPARAVGIIETSEGKIVESRRY